MPPLHKPFEISKLPFQKRKELASNKREKYPAHIPVIVKKGINVSEIRKKEYMVPCSNYVSEFSSEISKQMSPYNDIKLENTNLIFSKSGKIIPNSTFIEIYERYHNIDGFLYLTYHKKQSSQKQIMLYDLFGVSLSKISIEILYILLICFINNLLAGILFILYFLLSSY